MRKLESLFFYLLIFSIPFQTRLILHEWTRPFNQWASAYLYGTDVFLATVFVLWFIRFYRHCASLNLSTLHVLKLPGLSNPSVWLWLFVAVSVASIANSRLMGLSFYQLLKSAEFIGFYFYLKSNRGGIFDFKNLLLVVTASGFFQSVIAIVQYVKQGNLGLRLFGESPLSINTTGVAVFFADGEKYLRAYGTTPHPNVLAVWLFVAIFALYCLMFYRPDEVGKITKKWWMMLAVYTVLLSAFFFTFSRVIIALWLLGIIVQLGIIFFKKDQNGLLATGKKPIVRLVATTIIVGGLFSVIFWPQVKSRIVVSAQEEAVTQRIYYNKIAGSVAASHPLAGVGMGQFIPDMMARFKHLPAAAYQPVHNIYMLIASETGFIGLGLFLLFLFFVFWRFVQRADFKKLRTVSFLIFTFSFLLAGLFDHLFWTLQQGSLIFWTALALIDSRIKP